MQKRVFLIHGWGGAPENAWFPWLKNKLEERGFLVSVPLMPNADKPTISDWVLEIEGVVGESDSETYFIGHSIGCQAILRYVETIDREVGGVVCVAGFFKLLNFETEEEKLIAKPWLETPINFEKVKSVVKKMVAIFSDNDPDVDLGNKELFESYLGAKTLVEHNKGHFSDDALVKELPVALCAILEMME